MSNRYSDAVIALAEAASTPDLPVSPREIERWRQAGLLPAPQRGYPGRGSTSSYPDEAIRQAREIARLLKGGERLSEIAVPLFSSGYRLEEAVVKAAFKSAASRLEHVIRRRKPGAGAIDTAEAAADTLLRSLRGDPQLAEWRDRVRDREDSTAAILHSVVVNLIHILLTGRPASEDGLQEFYDAAGISAMVEGMSVAFGEEVGVSDLDVLLPKFQLAEYRRLVDQFSLDELTAAGSVVNELAGVAPTMLRLVAAAYGFSIPPHINERIAGFVETTVGFGLPIAASLLRERQDGLAEILETVRANRPQIDASAVLLELMPPEYHHYLGPGGEAALDAAPENERAAVQQFVLHAVASDERLAFLRERASPGVDAPPA